MPLTRVPSLYCHRALAGNPGQRVWHIMTSVHTVEMHLPPLIICLLFGLSLEACSLAFSLFTLAFVLLQDHGKR